MKMEDKEKSFNAVMAEMRCWTMLKTMEND